MSADYKDLSDSDIEIMLKEGTLLSEFPDLDTDTQKIDYENNPLLTSNKGNIFR